MKHARESWKHIRRTPHQALAAVTIMVLTFLTVSVFTFLIFGSSAIIKHFESKPQATAFFKDEAKPEEIAKLEENLKQTGKVSRTRFVTKSQALQIYEEQNKDDRLLLDLVTEDILPASLEISTYEIEDLTEISETLKGSPIISEVVYQRDIVDTLSNWTNAIRVIGVTIVIILTVVSIFIMMIIIGFKVSQKKDEIEIMKLLSATDWYIRLPFVLEGIFYGIAGTVIGWTIASVGLLLATPFLESFLKGISILPVSPVFLILLLFVELIIATALGVVASSLAVRRYLKVK